MSREFRRTWTALLLACGLIGAACTGSPEATTVDVAEVIVPAQYPGDTPNPSMRSWVEPGTTDGPNNVEETSSERMTPPPDPAEMLWIGTYLGYTDGSKDVTFILAPDGSVLRIDEGNIYAGSGSYLTWNIGPAGFEAVLDLMIELEVDQGDTVPVDSDETQVGSIRSDFGPRADIRGLNLPATQLTPEQRRVRASFRELLSSLEDMSWMDQFTVVTQRAPWIPDRLSLQVREEVNSQYYSTDPYRWPFEDSITEMIDVEAENDSEPFVCLEGAQAERAWTTFVVDGVNNARIPIESKGRRFEVTVHISYPMYHLFGDPCPGAVRFGTGENNDRVDRPDLSHLLLDDEDIGPEWTAGPASVAPPPPYVAPCAPITEAEVAVKTFDSWLSHKVDFTGIEHLVEGFQLIGWAPVGEDATAIVESIATYDCLDGLGEYGITHIESGLLPDAPHGAVAAYWITSYSDDLYGVVLDVALENGIVFAIGINAIVPVELSHLEEWLAVAVLKADAG